MVLDADYEPIAEAAAFTARFRQHPWRLFSTLQLGNVLFATSGTCVGEVLICTIGGGARSKYLPILPHIVPAHHTSTRNAIRLFGFGLRELVAVSILSCMIAICSTHFFPSRWISWVENARMIALLCRCLYCISYLRIRVHFLQFHTWSTDIHPHSPFLGYANTTLI